MPRPRYEPPPALADLYAELRELDVENLPEADAEDRTRASVLAFAVFFARRLKKVVFPAPMDWTRPSFDVVDDKLAVRVAWERLDGLADLASVVAEAGEREATADRPVILALDALDAEASEFQLEHALYGEVVVLDFRVRAPPTREPRIAAARERGWTGVLKEHNLLPGRSLVVPDGQHGLFLTRPEAAHLAGVLLLLPDGSFTMKLNPFAKAERNDPEMQYWLAWGKGDAASEWKSVLRVGDDPDAP